MHSRKYPWVLGQGRCFIIHSTVRVEGVGGGVSLRLFRNGGAKYGPGLTKWEVWAEKEKTFFGGEYDTMDKAPAYNVMVILGSRSQPPPSRLQPPFYVQMYVNFFLSPAYNLSDFTPPGSDLSDCTLHRFFVYTPSLRRRKLCILYPTVSVCSCMVCYDMCHPVLFQCWFRAALLLPVPPPPQCPHSRK